MNIKQNLHRIHTTAMGQDRICKNLKLVNQNAVEWCKNAVLNADKIILKGKNYYVFFNNAVVTINAKSYTIITAHFRTDKLLAKIGLQ